MAEENSGRYFPQGAYAQLPGDFRTPSLTVTGWFVWLDEDGPLLATGDGSWMLLYDRDGRCAYRVGDVERVTSLPTTWLRGRWLFVAMAKDRTDVTLWIDGVVDRWSHAADNLPWGETCVMRDAVGCAADIAVFERRLPDTRLQVFSELGRDRP